MAYLRTEIFTIRLEDVLAALEMDEKESRHITEADLYELRKRIADGLMSGFEDVAEAAWECMLYDRAIRVER